MRQCDHTGKEVASIRAAVRTVPRRDRRRREGPRWQATPWTSRQSGWRTCPPSSLPRSREYWRAPKDLSSLPLVRRTNPGNELPAPVKVSAVRGVLRAQGTASGAKGAAPKPKLRPYRVEAVGKRPKPTSIPAKPVAIEQRRQVETTDALLSHPTDRRGTVDWPAWAGALNLPFQAIASARVGSRLSNRYSLNYPATGSVLQRPTRRPETCSDFGTPADRRLHASSVRSPLHSIRLLTQWERRI